MRQKDAAQGVMKKDRYEMETENKKPVSRRRLEHWQVIACWLAAYDILAVNAAYLGALLLRFDLHFGAIPQEYFGAWLRFSPLYTVLAVAVFWRLHLYNSIWRFASFHELERILSATILTALAHTLGITLLFRRMPTSYYITGPVAQFCLVAAARFSYRYIRLEKRRIAQDGTYGNIMVIGAGAAGQTILRELRNSARAAGKAACVIDDNRNKWGRLIEGVPVVGGRESIPGAVEKYQIREILFAIPTATAEEKSGILEICKETGCALKSLPGLYQLANGEVTLNQMNAVAIEDLLGREPVQIDLEGVFRGINGKTVLVTGGGGSIGSELCRQVAAHGPKRLVVFDIYENNAYDIEQELRGKYGASLDLVVLVGSVRDSRRLDMVFGEYRPEIVYHAAAHKHVPLMEASPCEAVKNNVFGTYKTAYAAMKYGAARFVLVSTDKAVNPTNIMGASKRLCEMVVQSMDAVSRAGRLDMLPELYAHADPLEEEGTGGKGAAPVHNREAQEGPASGDIPGDVPGKGTGTGHSVTQYVAVRFGNVLGSNGSVIPLFKKQIEAGGPVTVTHPEIVRYFMTVQEAVSLVLQAGMYAEGGEIFVLDMGEPVKIDTLARNLIRLSGHVPDVDIKITYTGLRPGEKLYEEKLMAEEGLKKTENALIHIGKPVPFDVETFLGQLTELARASYANAEETVKLVEEMVPTFHPAGQHPAG